MRRLLLGVMAVAASLAMAGVSGAATINDYQNGDVANGIASSRHNLGKYGRVLTTDATTEICVFCHAPHHGTVGIAPLWNKKNFTANFAPYGPTIAGTNVGNPGGATLACLSCHDGVSTFDALINAPGKGNGGSNNKTITNFNWTWFMPGAAATHTNGTNLDFFGGFPTCINSSCHNPNDTNGPTRLNIGQAFGALGTPAGGPVTLTDDHPVSVLYSAGKASLRPTTVSLSSIDLTFGLNSTGQSSPNLAQNRWAIKGGITDTATIQDLLRGGKVECSSCHDPHFDNKSWDEVEDTWNHNPFQTYCSGPEDCSNGNFLRRVGGNTGSGVCRTCHNK
ncbi:MAG: hypothetical protein ACE5EI_03435 [Thermodesulfobacteriota bacterium]